MDCFTYQLGVLHAESVSLADIAEEYGTPVYVYSRRYLESRFGEYQQALLNHPHLICYAVKANSNIGLLNILARLGAGFDIVSQGELERVLLAGGDPNKVVFSGVAKTTDEITRALEVGIHCFNIESVSEMLRINDIAINLNTVARISIRVNPDVDAQTHPYISTGLKDNKFGIPIAQAMDVYVQAASLPGLKIAGIDCHIGSQLTEVTPFIDALDRLLILVDELSAQNIVLEHIDVGGGLGVRYQDETPPSPRDYIQAIIEKLADRELTLLLEPGRSICANAGILLTKVEYLKAGEEKSFAIVDAAMNDMIRPALYQAYMDITSVHEKSTSSKAIYDIVGPVCESGDFLGKDRKLSIAEGDLLAVHSAGAYGFTMSSNYNTRNRAAEVIVDGDNIHLVRERENYNYQLQLESLIKD